MLEGTEVFHRRCSRRISESIGTKRRLAIVKLKQRALELDQKLHEEKRQRGIDKQNADDLVSELKAANDEMHRETYEARKLRRDLADAKGRLHDDAGRIRALEASNANLQRQRSDLQAEADRLRAENGRLSAEALRRAKDDIPLAPESDLRDATEIRFSLLEIDKP